MLHLYILFQFPQEPEWHSVAEKRPARVPSLSFLSAIPLKGRILRGTPGRTRTCDLLIRSLKAGVLGRSLMSRDQLIRAALVAARSWVFTLVCLLLLLPQLSFVTNSSNRLTGKPSNRGCGAGRVGPTFIATHRPPPDMTTARRRRYSYFVFCSLPFS